jgi:hypothetical protein
MFIPYDTDLYLNYTTSQDLLPVQKISVLEDAIMKIQTYSFSSITKAGICLLQGPGITEAFNFNVTVLPELPSA